MSLIKNSLQRLDKAVESLGGSVNGVEQSIQDYKIAAENQNNVIDVNFVANRLDYAIEAVETILSEEE